MKRAILKYEFSMVQWLGEYYEDYQTDANDSKFKLNSEVLILHEFLDNNSKKQYVILCEEIQESAVVSSEYLELINEKKIMSNVM